MNREFRLTNSNDIKRVRRQGTSYAHPLVVLITAPNQHGLNRFGIIAGRAVGKAVCRNRAKRRLRAAVNELSPRLEPGWDAVLIARTGSVEAQWDELLAAVESLCIKAGVLRDE
jgi:ribonuclease P protein component